mgnify:CR=1 FL=1
MNTRTFMNLILGLRRIVNFRIGPRLVAGFLVFAGLIAIVGFVALSGLRAVGDSYKEALDQYNRRALVSLELKTAVLENVRAQKNYLLRADATYLSDVWIQEQNIRTLRNSLWESAADAADRELLNRLDASLSVFNNTFRSNIGLRERFGVESADDMSKGRAEDTLRILDEIADRARAKALAQERAAAAHQLRTQRVTFALVLIIVILAVASGLGLALSVTLPLKQLQSQIHAVADSQSPPERPAVEGRDEIAQIARTFHELVHKAALLQEMEARSRRLEALSTRIARAQEDERGRIARELHDGLGQVLTAIKLNLGALRRRLGSDDPARENVEKARRLTDESLDELRRLVVDLHPPALDNLGLAAALEALVRTFQEHNPIHVVVEADEIEQRLPFEAEAALYRICQEALNNITKHSQATDAVVRLKQEPEKVTLTIWDNGHGFDPEQLTNAAAVPQGIGLLSIERRAEELGGEFRLISELGQGTTIIVRIPRKPVKRDGDT